MFPLTENQGKPERTLASSGSRNGEGLLRRSNLEAMLVGDPVTRNITNTKRSDRRGLEGPGCSPALRLSHNIPFGHASRPAMSSPRPLEATGFKTETR